VRALAIETATSIASVGIVVEDQVAAERTLAMRGSHARSLLPLVDTALAAAGIGLDDLDLLAVSIGPGSFTGLRIGLSVAKGLALATGLPLVGVPTLEAYARTAGPRPGLLWPVLDARKGEVYAAAFRWGGAGLERVMGPATIAPGELARSVTLPCTLFGDGVDAYRELWRQTLGIAAELIAFAALPPSAAAVARLGAARLARTGADDLAVLEPSYCRPSQAEAGRTAAADRLACAGGSTARMPSDNGEKLTGGRR
jgi:tRNA threonylcarbamoyladenosine biosynthesis protein TsaB